MLKNALALSALATAMVCAAPAVAAEATKSVNVRSGPGTDYRVVDRLTRGEDVNVKRCRANGWCFITHPGPDGWVAARFLRDNGMDDDYFDTNRRPRPNLNFSIIIGGGGFQPGPGPRPDPAPREELVCLVTFFDEDDVEAGADADVERARVLPISEAEARDRPYDRRAIFDYGSDEQTIDTCNYLNDLNN